MSKSQDQVREFHRMIGQPTSPAEPKLRNPELRARLILEEAVETVVALVGLSRAIQIFECEDDKICQGSFSHREAPNLIEAIDGLCDLEYVVRGTAEDLGIDLDPFIDEVHRTNMLKANGPTDANGKRLKPPGWKKPDIEGVLARVAANNQFEFVRTNGCASAGLEHVLDPTGRCAQCLRVVDAERKR